MTTVLKSIQDPVKAIGFVKQMQALGVKADEFAFNTLVKICAKDTAKLGEAMMMMQQAGVKPNLVTMNTALNGLHDPVKAISFVKEVQALAVKADVVTFGTLLKICVKDTAKLDEALAMMQQARVKPDVVTMSTILKSIQDTAEAIEFVKKMQALGVAPNVVTFNTLLKICSKDENYFDEAMNLLVRSGVKPDVVTLNTILTIRKDPETALKILTVMMNQHHIIPDDITFRILERVCASSPEHLKQVAAQKRKQIIKK